MHYGFQVGQTVKLSSGGPAMTVDRVKDGVVECVWFEGAHLRCADFQTGVLTQRFDWIDDDMQTYGADNFG